jgi:hypothetical protein
LNKSGRVQKLQIADFIVVVACEYEQRGFYYVNDGSGGGSITANTGYAV